MASAPPHPNLALPVQDGQFQSSPSQYPPQQQQQHSQQSSGSIGHAQQTSIAPHLTQINPGVGPSNAHPPRSTAPPAVMAHPQQQPQLAGPSNSAMLNGNQVYIANPQDQMNRQMIEFQRRYNDLQARNNTMALALQNAQQKIEGQERNYNNIMTSWNEYKDANEAYKSEHERDTQRIKDLEEALAAKTKLVEQGWSAMATWKDAHEKETKKVEEINARMAKLTDQLNRTHLEGMQWKACALSWNDPKGEFQQALVQAISTKLGEQFSAREKTLLERIRELEYTVSAFRRLFPDAQLPPPPPPPAAVQAPQPPQPGPSGSNQPPPRSRPVPPPLTTSGSTTAAQSPVSAVAPHLEDVGRAGSSSTTANASPGAPFVPSPSEMQARLLQQQQFQERMIAQQQQQQMQQMQQQQQQMQQQMPGPSSSSRPPPAPSSQLQRQGFPQMPTSVPIPSTRGFPDAQYAGTNVPPARHAVRILPPNHQQHPSAPSPTTSNVHRRASLPIPSPSQQISPEQLALLARTAYGPQHEPVNPQQFLAQQQRTMSTGHPAPPPPAPAAGPSGSGSGPVPSASFIYFTNGRPAGFVAPRSTPSIPQKRPSYSEPQQQPPLQAQPPPVPELDLDDVIEIPAEEAAASIAQRQAELEEEARSKKRARLDEVGRDKGDANRDQSPDIPLSVQRRGSISQSPDIPLSVQRRASMPSIPSADAAGPSAPDVPSQPSLAVTPPAAVAPPSIQQPETPPDPPIMTRNQRTDSTASNLTVVPPLTDGSVSPPLVSPGPSSHRPSPEIGRLIPVVLGGAETETEDAKGEDSDDDQEEKSNAAGLEPMTGQGEDVVMNGSEVRGSIEAAKPANAMELDEPDTSASAEAQLHLTSRQQKQSTSPQPLSVVPPAAPPIAVLPPDDDLASPSTTEPGELKEIKSEQLDDAFARLRSTSSIEEGEVSRTRTPDASATAETPTSADATDVNMNDASRAESEDVKPVIRAGSEIVPKIEEPSDSIVGPAVNALVGMASGSQEEPIEIPDEMGQDGVIIDFLAVLFGVVEGDDAKVECELCSRKGSNETFSREDLGALVGHCENNHQRAWSVRVLDVLAERGIPYTPISPATA